MILVVDKYTIQGNADELIEFVKKYEELYKVQCNIDIQSFIKDLKENKDE